MSYFSTSFYSGNTFGKILSCYKLNLGILIRDLHSAGAFQHKLILNTVLTCLNSPLLMLHSNEIYPYLKHAGMFCCSVNPDINTYSPSRPSRLSTRSTPACMNSPRRRPRRRRTLVCSTRSSTSFRTEPLNAS